MWSGTFYKRWPRGPKNSLLLKLSKLWVHNVVHIASPINKIQILEQKQNITEQRYRKNKNLRLLLDSFNLGAITTVSSSEVGACSSPVCL